MEIIISDDHSTDNFMELVEQYKSLLNIKYFKTNEHKYHCPGNTRRDGLSHATGEWVTFMDHDDIIKPDSFKIVKQQLDANSRYNIPFIFSPVERKDKNGNSMILDAVTWIHGNFYKRQFLIDNNINFKEDLYGNEDLYFNNLVNGTVTGQGLSILKLDNPIYIWNYNEKSLSNSSFGELDYTEKYFGDYLIANSEPHILCYDKFPHLQSHFKRELTQALLYSYFYYQRALYNYGPIKTEEMLKDIKNITEKILLHLNMNKDQLLTEFFGDVERYNESRQIICALSGKFIETQSLIDFFKEL
jgi:glycosyltransferase involved in cell wall biosynthesis